MFYAILSVLSDFQGKWTIVSQLVEMWRLMHIFCQTPVLGLALGVEFTFARDKEQGVGIRDKG